MTVSCGLFSDASNSKSEMPGSRNLYLRPWGPCFHLQSMVFVCRREHIGLAAALGDVVSCEALSVCATSQGAHCLQLLAQILSHWASMFSTTNAGMC